MGSLPKGLLALAAFAVFAAALELAFGWVEVSEALAVADLKACTNAAPSGSEDPRSLLPVIKCAESTLPVIRSLSRRAILMEWILNAKTTWAHDTVGMIRILSAISDSAHPTRRIVEALVKSLLTGALVGISAFALRLSLFRFRNHQPRVLIIDDDSAFATGAGKALQRKGFSVDYAFNSKEAAPKLSNGNYDCVFCDYYLDDQTGTSLCERWVPENRKDRTVIMSGGEPTEMYRDQRMTEHFHFLRKPFAEKEVIALAHHVSDRK